MLTDPLTPSYTFQSISFSKNEQKSDWFLAVNPNGACSRSSARSSARRRLRIVLTKSNRTGRIPALVDVREGRKAINVWEVCYSRGVRGVGRR